MVLSCAVEKWMKKRVVSWKSPTTQKVKSQLGGDDGGWEVKEHIVVSVFTGLRPPRCRLNKISGRENLYDCSLFPWRKE